MATTQPKKMTPGSVEKFLKSMEDSVHFREGKMILVRNFAAVELEYEDGTSKPWGTGTSVTSVDWSEVDPECLVERIPRLLDRWSGLRVEDDGSGDDDYFFGIHYWNFEKLGGRKSDFCGQGDILKTGNSCIWLNKRGKFAQMEVKKDGNLSLGNL